MSAILPHKMIGHVLKAFRRSLIETLLPLTVISAAPVVLTRNLWSEIWRGILPRAWDGTGHFAIAQIYDQSIFPETFGWTHHYFGGMPFPNFYPPVYYWLIALLHHTQAFSFPAAFKIVTVLPVLLIPSAQWMLGWKLSGRERVFATAVALATVPLLIDGRFQSTLPAGLDYFSTFQIGLYTQPLGFVLMIVWYVVYTDCERNQGRFAAASILLALTLLSNFFNATVAVVFVVSTLAADLARCFLASDVVDKTKSRRAFIAHVASPLFALGVGLLWIVPMLGRYEYFVTRPQSVEVKQILTAGLLCWYVVSLVGSVLWLRRPNDFTKPYLATCLIVLIITFFPPALAPTWFPLQSPRFLTTLNFLLAVPTGYALVAFFQSMAHVLGEVSGKDRTLDLRRARYTAGVAGLLFLLLFLTSSGPPWGWAYAYYTNDEMTAANDVLGFARRHRDGRYLVEVLNPQINAAYTEASFDTRAINSYLGAQGNETLSAVFHEASPNALFSLPAVNALSNYPDNFGISSMLADDLDYADQPLTQHIERARQLGVRYLVIRTPLMKERIAKEKLVVARADFGWWSIFQLREPPPRVSVLTYRPALVISSFTLKLRRRNELSFIRFAEEQFADNWFDVLLVRSPEPRLDRLKELDQFGAVIIETYDYDDEDLAFTRLRDFAQARPLILLSAETKLFERISTARSEFPYAVIIDRKTESKGEVIEKPMPTYHYATSSIRQQWETIREVLERTKMPVGDVTGVIESKIESTAIDVNINSDAVKSAVPVLIRTTFHPNWHREDGQYLYAATPFYMLTFARQPVSLKFDRQGYEWFGFWVSACILLAMLYLIFLNLHHVSSTRLREMRKVAPRTKL